jgi:hypothetical protein
MPNHLFQHFLITRFNLTSSFWNKTREGEQVLDESWLEDRFALFERHCLPSVRNQTNKNFYWLIFFDTSTPEKFRSRVANIQNSSNFIYCYFINGAEEFNFSIITAIYGLVLHGINWIITTRLDNDDMIHKSFINEIQNCQFSNESCYIDIPIGYQMSLMGENIEVRNRHNPISTFSSLYERVEENQHIFSKRNFEWKDFSCKKIIQKRLWIEVVHQRNLVNSLVKENALTLDCKLTDFGFHYNWTLIDLMNVYTNKLSLRLQKMLKNNR